MTLVELQNYQSTTKPLPYYMEPREFHCNQITKFTTANNIINSSTTTLTLDTIDSLMSPRIFLCLFNQNVQIGHVTACKEERWPRIRESERQEHDKQGDMFVANRVSLELESIGRCCKEPARCPFSICTFTPGSIDRSVRLAEQFSKAPRTTLAEAFREECAAFAV